MFLLAFYSKYFSSCITRSWEHPPPYFFSSKVIFFAELESSIKKFKHLSRWNLLAVLPLKATAVASLSTDPCWMILVCKLAAGRCPPRPAPVRSDWGSSPRWSPLISPLRAPPASLQRATAWPRLKQTPYIWSFDADNFTSRGNKWGVIYIQAN